MSSPTNTPKKSSKRSTPKRTPLQERSSSEKNETAARVGREQKTELSDADIFSATPFPTKPQHVLLPSTIKSKRSKQNVENELPSFFASSQPTPISAASRSKQRRNEQPLLRKPPNLQLKRSVTALRDIYEAQAEKSRPTTATLSPPLRPSTAGSRIRSISSVDGLSGRNAWESLALPRISSDDTAILPPLTEYDVHLLNAKSSFAERMQSHAISSSPNFRVLDVSSPVVDTYQDPTSSSDPVESSSPILQAYAGSSPNFVRLANSSSIVLTDPTPASLLEYDEQNPSSPNLVKLGTSSPVRSSSPTPSQSSTTSRKRKRSNFDDPLATRKLASPQRASFPSSPPVDINPRSSDTSIPSSEVRVLPSSPPEIGTARSNSVPSSSPVFRVHARESSESRSVTSAHTNLQSALSSSPRPQILYPIVRAPRADQFESLNVGKRNTSREQYLMRVPTYPTRTLSPVPSEILVGLLRSDASAVDVAEDVLDESLLSEDLSAAQAYILESDRNGSQDQIISELDRHEADDELSALPQESRYMPTTFLGRGSIFHGASMGNASSSRLNSLRTSTDTQLSSMRSMSFGRTRSDSLKSGNFRPGSAGSQMSSSVVPTWARRYYSGLYRDSFHYLYSTSHNVITVAAPSQAPPASQTPSLLQDSASSKRSRFSIDSARQKMSQLAQFVPTIRLPKERPKPDVRKSHLTVGSGPLVSNPVRPASAVLRRTPGSPSFNNSTIRRVSEPLLAIDPRAHWAGADNEEYYLDADDPQAAASAQLTPSNSQGQLSATHSHSRKWSRLSRRLPSPHLHHDKRLGTGSSASAGFGAPYNRRSRFLPDDIYEDPGTRPSWFTVDLKRLQLVCFISGFVLPFMWFVGALAPLPHRPTGYHDMEKAEARANIDQHAPSFNEAADMDVVGRLRLERHLRGLEEARWQYARWWKRMNIFMSFVGVVVIVVIVVLAVIGTHGHW